MNKKSRWINRAVIVVRPGRPFIDWASRLDDEAPGQAHDLEKRVSVYLGGEDPEEKEETAPLEGYYKKIFEDQLGGWSLDKGDWPKDRTLAMFLQWFDVARESVVTDLESGPIVHEQA